MPIIETIRESVILKVDFVAASAAREARPAPGGALVIDFEAARLARCTEEPTPMPRPRRPGGGRPGKFGGPF